MAAFVTATAGQVAQVAAATVIEKAVSTFGSKKDDDQSQTTPLLDDDSSRSTRFTSMVRQRGHSHSASLTDDRLRAIEEGQGRTPS